MNDRSLCLLDNYEIEVLRTRKGRGAILCETNQGTLIWKEYLGHQEKVVFQNSLLNLIRERGFLNGEQILKNKEGQLLTQDVDGTFYLLKTYVEGRECNIREGEECRQAVRTLAAFHNAARIEEPLPGAGMARSAKEEFEKHNRELRRVQKYLKSKGQKTDFELYLMKNYEYFLNMALQVTQEAESLTEDSKKSYACHGDFQYHNLILSGNQMYMINFEKCGMESPVKDLYLFMRKLLEKNGWASDQGFALTDAYEKVRALETEEYRQLYYRLSYPEKFWKIVNFYYNSGKAWIPGKNLEKLQRIIEQDREKQAFLDKFRRNYGL